MVNKSNAPSRPIIKKEIPKKLLKTIQVKTESCASGEKNIKGNNVLNQVDEKNISSPQCNNEPTIFFSNFKDGQKIPSPPVGDGTRAFYESLLKEKSNSIMATKYCVENGILELGAFKKMGGVKTDILAEAKKKFDKLYKETKTPLQPSSSKPVPSKMAVKKRTTTNTN